MVVLIVKMAIEAKRKEMERFNKIKNIVLFVRVDS